MKRLFAELVCFLVPVAAAAQVNPSAQSNEPLSYEPQHVNLRSDGRCMTVHPGDVVQYTLTVENLADAQTVYGDLRLRLGRTREIVHEGLPLPDFRSLGGGGAGTRDSGDARLYHFAFKVPQEIYGGTYRGAGIEVRPQGSSIQPVHGRSAQYHAVSQEYAPHVEVTRRTRAEVHGYCLNILSSFGMTAARHPAVTSFEPGAVEPSQPAPAAVPPAPLPQEPATVPLQMVPQPR